MGYFPRRTEYEVWNQQEWEKNITSNKAREEESVKPSDIRHGATGFGIALLGFWLDLAQYFINMSQLIPFEMIIHILYHCVL